ncbi:MAG: hypothetical protein ACFFDK_17240 [Promethearchaeota archaeon]
MDENFENIGIVKKYFSRIFSVLSKEVREKLLNLNLSDKVIKIVLKDLAFLTEEKQKEYLDELKNKTVEH